MAFTQMAMFLEELENTKMVYNMAIDGYNWVFKNHNDIFLKKIA